MRSLFCIVLLAALSACGPSTSKDSVTMTVNAGFPVQPRSPVNLSQSLMSLMSVTIGTDCYQDQIYLVVHDPATDEVLSAKKVKMRTNLAPNPALNYNNTSAAVKTVIDYLLTNTFLDEPLTIEVPKGRRVEIGIIGTFFNPTDANHDGICDQTSGTTALNSSSMVGHAVVDANALKTGAMNLNIDVMHTNPSGVYALSIGRYHDWVEVSTQFTFGAAQARLKTISYLNVAGPQGLIKINVDIISASKYYIPNMFPYVLEFEYSYSNFDGLYRTTVSDAQSNVANNTDIGINAQIYQTITGTPPPAVSSNLTNSFSINRY